MRLDNKLKTVSLISYFSIVTLMLNTFPVNQIDSSLHLEVSIIDLRIKSVYLIFSISILLVGVLHVIFKENVSLASVAVAHLFFTILLGYYSFRHIEYCCISMSNSSNEMIITETYAIDKDALINKVKIWLGTLNFKVVLALLNPIFLIVFLMNKTNRNSIATPESFSNPK
ncbi:MAG: hypothetical protein AB8F74_12230 [Saprospiraceae bacterium]